MAANYSKQIKQLQGLIAGFTAAMPGGATTFLVTNTSYTQATLLAFLNGLLAILKAVPDADLARGSALKARALASEQISTTIDDMQSALRGSLGSSPVALAPYGVAPIKDPTPLTGEQNVVKAAKGLATRKARGTLGKRQKAAIKGVVPAAPAPVATPAVATPAGPIKGT